MIVYAFVATCKISYVFKIQNYYIHIIHFFSIFIFSPFRSSLTIDYIQYCFEKYSVNIKLWNQISQNTGEPFNYRVIVFVRYLSEFLADTCHFCG